MKEYRHHADTPYIINPTWATRKIDVEAAHLDLIRAGMRDVIMHLKALQKRCARGVEIAGKTGSAQYRKRVGDQVEDQVYAWMISYAPFDAPRYAVAMIVEDGVSVGRRSAHACTAHTSSLPTSAHRKEESYERLSPKKMDFTCHPALTDCIECEFYFQRSIPDFIVYRRHLDKTAHLCRTGLIDTYLWLG